MPRSTKSKRVQDEAPQAVVVDEVQDPQVEQALDNAELPGMWEQADLSGGEADNADLVEPTHDEKWGAIDAEFAETNEDEPVDHGENHAADFNWDTMTWTAAKGGSHPCMCNRLNGHQCELTTKSRFATGHDARFKGILQKAYRKGEPLEVDFGPEDNASVEDMNGDRQPLSGRVVLQADVIARILTPKLLPHVTHDTRAARLQKLDAQAGTTVPQTAADHKADEELTDADVEAQVDDAPEFVEA